MEILGSKEIVELVDTTTKVEEKILIVGIPCCSLVILDARQNRVYYLVDEVKEASLIMILSILFQRLVGCLVMYFFTSTNSVEPFSELGYTKALLRE